MESTKAPDCGSHPHDTHRGQRIEEEAPTEVEREDRPQCKSGVILVGERTKECEIG